VPRRGSAPHGVGSSRSAAPNRRRQQSWPGPLFPGSLALPRGWSGGAESAGALPVSPKGALSSAVGLAAAPDEREQHGERISARPLTSAALQSSVSATARCCHCRRASDANPFTAVKEAVEAGDFDEIIISTLADAGVAMAAPRSAPPRRGARPSRHRGPPSSPSAPSRTLADRYTNTPCRFPLGSNARGLRGWLGWWG
jgi:hypothetical protein